MKSKTMIWGLMVMIVISITFLLRLQVKIENLEANLSGVQNENRKALDSKNVEIADLEALIKLQDDLISEKDEINGYLIRQNEFFYQYYFASSELLNLQVDMLSRTDVSKCFIIYGPDANAENVVRRYYLEIPENQSLEQQLHFLCDALSKYSFTNYPIEFIKIIDQGGKKVAHINLSNPEDLEDAWIIHYFQGSTGGIMTANTLIESFLQSDTNMKDWIDAVQFTFEGKRGYLSVHDSSLFRYTYYRNGSKVED